MNIIKKPLHAVLKRSLYTRGHPVNPIPLMMKVTHEHDTRKLEKCMHFITYVVIPVSTGYMWYDFYQHNIVHRTRMPWPDAEYMNNCSRPYPWGDGLRSAFFHPYFNFTKYGYVTDPDGNPLPPGQYSKV